MYIFLITVAIFILFIWLLSSPFYWRSRGVPFQIPLPIFGSMMPLFYQSLTTYWQTRYHQWKGHPWYGYHFFMSPALFLSDPEMIRRVCVIDSDYFMSHGFPLNQDLDLFGKNLFHIEGEQWRAVRAKMSPYFTPARVKGMTPLLRSHTEHFISRMRELAAVGPVEVQLNLSMRLSTDVLVSSGFGVESNSFEEEDPFFYSIQKELMKPVTGLKIFISLFSSRVYDALGLTFFSKPTTEKVESFVRDIVELRNKGVGVRPDLFQGMVDLMKKEKENEEKGTHYKDGTRVARFDLQGVTAQTLIFYLAGTETTGSTLGFILHELAYNEEIQDKVRREITSVKDNINEAFTYDEIQSLSYTHMVINESLRKYPIVPILTRSCTRPYKYGSVSLEKGTFIMISTFALHRDPEYFPEPDKFIPERFGPEAQIKNGTYLPFGTGPRTCIGMKFSLHEIAFALTRIIPSFRLYPSKKSPYDLELQGYNPTLITKNGIWLEVEPI